MASTGPENRHILHGGCTCERNRYIIHVPPDSTSLAQVYFDNSVANRRAQASPLTAWLRVPLSWYHSATIAHFPDESHSSIKRTFTHPADVRRQFCGYCGTHLTAWDEEEAAAAAAAATGIRASRAQFNDGGGSDGWLDVTMGSLSEESLGRLEGLGLVRGEEEDDDDDDEDYDDDDDDDDEEEAEGGKAHGQAQAPAPTYPDPAHGLGEVGMVNDETHIPASTSVGEAAAATATRARASSASLSPSSSLPYAWVSRRMRNRGVPFFEAMVEGSALGRIGRRRRRRVRGERRSAGGRATVRWEVIEMVDDGDDDDDDDDDRGDGGADASMPDVGVGDSGSGMNKRMKLSG